MTVKYDNKAREKIRVEFANHRRQKLSIAEASKAAGISPSTYYAWNKDDGWSKKGGWSK